MAGIYAGPAWFVNGFPSGLVGKTTLARQILAASGAGVYLNWDNREDRREIRAARWPGGEGFVVLDELHKWRAWKSWIKREFDKHRDRLQFLVTGSARLDVYRRGGDSLQGRYHHYRLHPLSCGEVATGDAPTRPTAWQKDRPDRFFREDVRDLESVRDLSALQLLADLLPERVGSPLSLNALREDLEASHQALTHWMDILERLYHVFRIRPFSARSIRSLRKMSKAYLWDWSLVPAPGPRFENLLGAHLLKLCHFLQDTEGLAAELHYMRDRAGREVDFLVTIGKKPWFAVEAKLSETRIDPALEDPASLPTAARGPPRFRAGRRPVPPGVQVPFRADLKRVAAPGLFVRAVLGALRRRAGEPGKAWRTGRSR